MSEAEREIEKVRELTLGIGQILVYQHLLFKDFFEFVCDESENQLCHFDNTH